jgi:hypothetical protein
MRISQIIHLLSNCKDSLAEGDADIEFGETYPQNCIGKGIKVGKISIDWVLSKEKPHLTDIDPLEINSVVWRAAVLCGLPWQVRKDLLAQVGLLNSQR